MNNQEDKISEKVSKVVSQAEVLERLAAIGEKGTHMFESVEERNIGSKAIGAYIGVLSLMLNEFFAAHPEVERELGNIIGRAAAECTLHVL